jgi:DNA-binding response OmpR family regulator
VSDLAVSCAPTTFQIKGLSPLFLRRKVASEPRIKLLFTDVGLPGPFNGRQIADEARKLRSDLKILFTTGYAQNAIIHQGRLDPGVQLMVKPFNFAGLAAKIRQMFDEAE